MKCKYIMIQGSAPYYDLSEGLPRLNNPETQLPSNGDDDGDLGGSLSIIMALSVTGSHLEQSGLANGGRFFWK